MTAPEDPTAALLARRRDLLRRVRAGEWLRTGDVAALLDLSRTTTHRLVVTGRIRAEKKPGGQQRYCDPADVLKLVNEAGTWWLDGDDEPAPPPEP